LRLVDGRQQQPLVAREFLAVAGRARGVNHGHQIVRAETPLDELLRRALDALGPTEPRVEIVDDHHVDAAFERALVRADVGLERRRGVQRAVGTLDRDVDEREGIDRLRLAVFQDLEVFLLQFANDLALAIRDDNVDFDVIDGEWWLRRLLRRQRLPAGGHRTDANTSAPLLHVHTYREHSTSESRGPSQTSVTGMRIGSSDYSPGYT
jgi:hypothetical protein